MRLLLALLLPSALVAFAMYGLQDVRWAFLFYVLGGCILGPWLLLGRAGGFPFWRSTRAAKWWVIGQLLLCGPGLFFVYDLLRPYVGDPAKIVGQLQSMGWQHDQRILYALLFVACVPLAEEWWWRGRALPLCEARFGLRGGRWVNALSFALYHLFVLSKLYPASGVVLRMAFIVGGGLFWAELAGRQRSWALAYVGHFAADAGIAAIYLWSFR